MSSRWRSVELCAARQHDYDREVTRIRSVYPPKPIIAGRFHVVGELGVGGMATVYEVHDHSTGRRLALKRLHEQRDAARRQRTVELFEREFHTLAHLAHPRVVTAYDYGVDDAGPFYTMELLDGGELSQLAPLTYRRACQIGRDIATALSLVHSRRLVFRDLNPRNVRCTSDGIAKLIDFGAMTPIGPCKQAVGTPAYCAPEVLDFAPLDARTDLFSLGATLYFMLTGRHAYVARTFDQMRALLETTRPPRPGELVAGVPLSLDNLIMELLHPEPGVRPANVAEVIEQLSVIEGRTYDELPDFTQAYLSTPSLVGRDAMLVRVREKITRAHKGRGSCLVIEGAAGVGRSRMLTACRIEAKLLGLLTLQVDATNGQADYGVLRALAAQLRVAVPELTLRAAAPQLPVLGHVLDDFLELKPDTELRQFVDHNRLRAALFDAAQSFLAAVCEERPLFIAVDDIHAIDEPSAAVLGLVSRGLAQQRLLVLASVETGAASRASADALKLIATGPATTTLRLRELSLADTEQLLRAVFGDVPNVQAIAHKLFDTTQGNPRDLMQLAQFLVDERLAHYRAGAWSLPAELDSAAVPADMAQAQRKRVAALDPRARALAAALTLTLDCALSFEECQWLARTNQSGEVVKALGALQTAQFVDFANERYALSKNAGVAALQADLAPEVRREAHLALAEICERRGQEEFRRGQHLFRAGELERAIDVWVAFAIDSTARTDADPKAFQALVASLPDDWLETYLEGVRACEASGRPLADLHRLRMRFAGLVNVMNVPSRAAQPQIRGLLRQLAQCSGLQDWLEQEDVGLDPGARLKQALGAAQQRYDAAPEAARVVPVRSALTELTRVVIGAAGMVSSSLDHTLALAIPSLAPLGALSPALHVVECLRRGALSRASGRFEQACAIYRELLEFASRPDRAGLDASNHRFMSYGVMAAIGLMEANFGMPSCLSWADQIEPEPLYTVCAVQIRMVYALWQGRVHDADAYEDQFQLLRIQTGPRHLADGPYLIGRVSAAAASDDMTRLKRSGEEILGLAQRHAGWWPAHEYALGEYQRVRGRALRALSHIETALGQTSPGTHPLWSHIAAARVRVLREQGGAADAVKAGQQYLDLAAQAELGAHAHHIRIQLAHALVDHGDFASAAAHADAAIEGFGALGCQGLPLAFAYEARGRAALAAQDVAVYETALAKLVELVRASQSRGLRTRHERLRRAARVVGLPATEVSAPTAITNLSSTQHGSLFIGCSSAAQRAQRTLQLLLQHSGARDGILFWNTAGGRVVAAKSEAATAPEELSDFLDQYMATDQDDMDFATCSQESVVPDTTLTRSAWLANDGTSHRLVVLSHQTSRGHAVTGVAVLRVSDSEHFDNPGALAAAISRRLTELGDVDPTEAN